MRQAVTKMNGQTHSEDVQTDTLYWVIESSCYAVTPDGIGFYWYDDEDEATEQHGNLPVVTVDEITDF